MRQTSKNVSPMSNEGRNLYVITHITESLLELLKDKPLNDISISELCSHAQVGRATFYRNFEVKEDVLNVYPPMPDARGQAARRCSIVP